MSECATVDCEDQAAVRVYPPGEAPIDCCPACARARVQDPGTVAHVLPGHEDAW